MEHKHNHERPAALKNLVFAIIINGGIMAFEMIFGFLIQSMALISDAVHNLSDIAAMIFSYWAEKVSRRPANERKTYGYHKIEFIAAFVNSIVLSVWVAVVAFVGNGAATLLLQKISARNFNMKSAWLHSLQDALFSLAVIIGALVIMLMGWSLVDPLLSLAICLVIAREIYKIVRQTVSSLLDAVPPDIDYGEVFDDLSAIPSVTAVRDLHIWRSGGAQKLLSAHLRTAEGADNETIIRAAQELLLHKYGINHTTLQLLPDAAGKMEHCHHCN